MLRKLLKSFSFKDQSREIQNLSASVDNLQRHCLDLQDELKPLREIDRRRTKEEIEAKRRAERLALNPYNSKSSCVKCGHDKATAKYGSVYDGSFGICAVSIGTVIW